LYNLTGDPISEVRTLTEDKRVIVEGVITQYKRHNQSTLNIFIQDATTAYAGMNIYVKNTSLPSVSIGQKIRVMGLAHLYQGIIEIGSATDHPVITILDSDIETAPKSITAEEITEENLYLFVELANPPFTVTSIETGIEKYVTFTDNLGNSFLLNNDWVTDNPYFYGPLDPEGADVLTSLKGLVSYRFVNEAPIFTLNPRAESDFEFLIEE